MRRRRGLHQELTTMVKGLSDATRVVFNDQRAVANAGVMLPGVLADRLGIEALIDQIVDLGERPGAANPGRKVMTLLSAMALGADCVDDCALLRSGQTSQVLGHVVEAPSTLGTFLRAFTFGHVRQLDTDGAAFAAELFPARRVRFMRPLLRRGRGKPRERANFRMSRGQMECSRSVTRFRPRRSGRVLCALAAASLTLAASAGGATYKQVKGSPFPTAGFAERVEFDPAASILASESSQLSTQSSSINFRVVSRDGTIRPLARELSVHHDLSGLGLGPFSPNGRFLIVWHHGLEVHRFTSGGPERAVAHWHFATSLDARGAVFSPKGFLAVVSFPLNHRAGSAVWMFSLKPSGAIRLIPGSPFPIGSSDYSSDGIAFSRDGTVLANVDNSGGGPGRIETYGVSSSGRVTSQLASAYAGNDPRVPAFDPAGDVLAISNYTPSTITAFRVAGNGALTKIPGTPLRSGSGGGPVTVAFSPTGRSLAVANTNGHAVTVFSVHHDGQLGPKTVASAFPHTSPDDLSFSSNGRFVAVASYYGAEVTVSETQ